MPHHNTMTAGVQNGQMIGWLQWGNIAGSLYKEKEAAEKDDKRHLLDRCSSDLLNHELRVASYDIKITSYELKSMSYSIKSTSYELESTSYNIKSMSYSIKSTSYEL